MDELKKLWSLQHLDEEIRKLLEEEDELRLRRECPDPALEELSMQKEQLQGQLAEKRKMLRRREQDLQELVQRKRVIYEKLYGSSVVRGRELEQLEKQYHQLGEGIGRAEDGIIQVMEEAENTEHALFVQDRELQELEDRAAGEMQQLDREREELLEKIQLRKTERSSLASQVSDDLLETYEHLSRSFHGRGVAGLRGGLCEGCQVFQSSSLRSRIHEPGARVYCESCGRLLVKMD